MQAQGALARDAAGLATASALDRSIADLTAGLQPPMSAAGGAERSGAFGSPVARDVTPQTLAEQLDVRALMQQFAVLQNQLESALQQNPSLMGGGSAVAPGASGAHPAASAGAAFPFAAAVGVQGLREPSTLPIGSGVAGVAGVLSAPVNLQPFGVPSAGPFQPSGHNLGPIMGGGHPQMPFSAPVLSQGGQHPAAAEQFFTAAVGAPSPYASTALAGLAGTTPLSNDTPGIRAFNAEASRYLERPSLFGSGLAVGTSQLNYSLLKLPAHHSPKFQDTAVPMPAYVDPTTGSAVAINFKQSLFTKVPSSPQALAALFDYKPHHFIEAVARTTEELRGILDAAEFKAAYDHGLRVIRALHEADGRDPLVSWAALGYADQRLRIHIWRHPQHSRWDLNAVQQDPELMDALCATTMEASAFVRKYPTAIAPHTFRSAGKSGGGSSGGGSGGGGGGGYGGGSSTARGGGGGGGSGTRPSGRQAGSKPETDAAYIKGTDCPFFFHNGPGKCRWGDNCMFAGQHRCVYCHGPDHASTACPSKLADPSIARL